MQIDDTHTTSHALVQNVAGILKVVFAHFYQAI